MNTDLASISVPFDNSVFMDSRLRGNDEQQNFFFDIQQALTRQHLRRRIPYLPRCSAEQSGPAIPEAIG
jgi:hypothetical protein